MQSWVPNQGGILRRSVLLIALAAATMGGCARRESPPAAVGPSLANDAPPPADGAGSTEPGATACGHGRICFRGRTGPYTGNPLFIVDGVRYATSIDSTGVRHGWPDLKPDDIESVEVHGGPQAIERYGPEAREGVIIVRTKRASGDA